MDYKLLCFSQFAEAAKVDTKPGKTAIYLSNVIVFNEAWKLENFSFSTLPQKINRKMFFILHFEAVEGKEEK